MMLSVSQRQRNSRKIEEAISFLQKNFECAICLDLMKNPVTTRCDHKFCRHCLMETLGTKTRAPCPLCKKTFTKRSLQPLTRWNEIVTMVGNMAAAFQKDTGTVFSPTKGPLSSSPVCTTAAEIKLQKQPETRRSSKAPCQNPSKRRNVRITKHQAAAENPQVYIEDESSSDAIAEVLSVKSNTNIRDSFPVPAKEKVKGKNSRPAPAIEDLLTYLDDGSFTPKSRSNLQRPKVRTTGTHMMKDKPDVLNSSCENSSELETVILTKKDPIEVQAVALKGKRSREKSKSETRSLNPENPSALDKKQGHRLRNLGMKDNAGPEDTKVKEVIVIQEDIQSGPVAGTSFNSNVTFENKKNLKKDEEQDDLFDGAKWAKGCQTELKTYARKKELKQSKSTRNKDELRNKILVDDPHDNSGIETETREKITKWFEGQVTPTTLEDPESIDLTMDTTCDEMLQEDVNFKPFDNTFEEEPCYVVEDGNVRYIHNDHKNIVNIYSEVSHASDDYTADDDMTAGSDDSDGVMVEEIVEKVDGIKLIRRVRHQADQPPNISEAAKHIPNSKSSPRKKRLEKKTPRKNRNGVHSKGQEFAFDPVLFDLSQKPVYKVIVTSDTDEESIHSGPCFRRSSQEQIDEPQDSSVKLVTRTYQRRTITSKVKNRSMTKSNEKKTPHKKIFVARNKKTPKKNKTNAPTFGTPTSDDPYAFKVSQRTPKEKKKKKRGKGRIRERRQLELSHQIPGDKHINQLAAKRRKTKEMESKEQREKAEEEKSQTELDSLVDLISQAEDYELLFSQQVRDMANKEEQTNYTLQDSDSDPQERKLVYSETPIEIGKDGQQTVPKANQDIPNTKQRTSAEQLMTRLHKAEGDSYESADIVYRTQSLTAKKRETRHKSRKENRKKVLEDVPLVPDGDSDHKIIKDSAQVSETSKIIPATDEGILPLKRLSGTPAHVYQVNTRKTRSKSSGPIIPENVQTITHGDEVLLEVKTTFNDIPHLSQEKGLVTCVDDSLPRTGGCDHKTTEPGELLPKSNQRSRRPVLVDRARPKGRKLPHTVADWSDVKQMKHDLVRNKKKTLMVVEKVTTKETSRRGRRKKDGETSSDIKHQRELLAPGDSCVMSDECMIEEGSSVEADNQRGGRPNTRPDEDGHESSGACPSFITYEEPLQGSICTIEGQGADQTARSKPHGKFLVSPTKENYLSTASAPEEPVQEGRDKVAQSSPIASDTVEVISDDAGPYGGSHPFNPVLSYETGSFDQVLVLSPPTQVKKSQRRTFSLGVSPIQAKSNRKGSHVEDEDKQIREAAAILLEESKEEQPLQIITSPKSVLEKTQNLLNAHSELRATPSKAREIRSLSDQDVCMKGETMQSIRSSRDGKLSLSKPHRHGMKKMRKRLHLEETATMGSHFEEGEVIDVDDGDSSSTSTLEGRAGHAIQDDVPDTEKGIKDRIYEHGHALEATTRDKLESQDMIPDSTEIPLVGRNVARSPDCTAPQNNYAELYSQQSKSQKKRSILKKRVSPTSAKGLKKEPVSDVSDIGGQRNIDAQASATPESKEMPSGDVVTTVNVMPSVGVRRESAETLSTQQTISSGQSVSMIPNSQSVRESKHAETQEHPNLIHIQRDPDEEVMQQDGHDSGLESDHEIRASKAQRIRLKRKTVELESEDSSNEDEKSIRIRKCKRISNRFQKLPEEQTEFHRQRMEEKPASGSDQEGVTQVKKKHDQQSQLRKRVHVARGLASGRSPLPPPGNLMPVEKISPKTPTTQRSLSEITWKVPGKQEEGSPNVTSSGRVVVPETPVTTQTTPLFKKALSSGGPQSQHRSPLFRVTSKDETPAHTLNTRTKHNLYRITPKSSPVLSGSLFADTTQGVEAKSESFTKAYDEDIIAVESIGLDECEVHTQHSESLLLPITSRTQQQVSNTRVTRSSPRLPRTSQHPRQSQRSGERPGSDIETTKSPRVLRRSQHSDERPGSDFETTRSPRLSRRSQRFDERPDSDNETTRSPRPPRRSQHSGERLGSDIDTTRSPRLSIRSQRSDERPDSDNETTRSRRHLRMSQHSDERLGSNIETSRSPRLSRRAQRSDERPDSDNETTRSPRPLRRSQHSGEGLGSDIETTRSSRFSRRSQRSGEQPGSDNETPRSPRQRTMSKSPGKALLKPDIDAQTLNTVTDLPEIDKIKEEPLCLPVSFVTSGGHLVSIALPTSPDHPVEVEDRDFQSKEELAAVQANIEADLNIPKDAAMPIIRNPLVMGESDESSEDDMILPSLEPCSQRLARLAAHKGHPTTISDDTDKDDEGVWRLRRRSRRARNVIEDDESIDGAITDTSVTCRTLNATGSSSVSSQSEIINTEMAEDLAEDVVKIEDEIAHLEARLAQESPAKSAPQNTQLAKGSPTLVLQPHPETLSQTKHDNLGEEGALLRDFVVLNDKDETLEIHGDLGDVKALNHEVDSTFKNEGEFEEKDRLEEKGDYEEEEFEEEKTMKETIEPSSREASVRALPDSLSELGQSDQCAQRDDQSESVLKTDKILRHSARKEKARDSQTVIVKDKDDPDTQLLETPAQGVYENHKEVSLRCPQTPSRSSGQNISPLQSPSPPTSPKTHSLFKNPETTNVDKTPSCLQNLSSILDKYKTNTPSRTRHHTTRQLSSSGQKRKLATDADDLSAAKQPRKEENCSLLRSPLHQSTQPAVGSGSSKASSRRSNQDNANCASVSPADASRSALSLLQPSVSPNVSSGGSFMSVEHQLPQRPDWCFISSGIKKLKQKLAIQKFQCLVGTRGCTRSVFSATHLIVGPVAAGGDPLVCQRTLKYFQAIAGHKWIVSVNWVLESMKLGQLLPEDDYEIHGDSASHEQHHAPQRSRIQQTHLLKGYEVCCHGDLANISCSDLCDLVDHCGGMTVLQEDLFSFDPGFKQVIVMEVRDDLDLDDLRRLYRRYEVPIVSKDWVLDSIGQYKVQRLTDYAVSLTGDTQVIELN